MRQITDHIVSGDQPVQLKIDVMDEPGAGGANHEYLVTWTPNPKPKPTIAELEAILQEPETHVNLLPDGQFVDAGRILVRFQNGPIKECGVNGITQEALLAIVIDRPRSFQAGPYASPLNYSALRSCEEALGDLQQRTLDRIARGVEGTHQK